MPTQVAVVVTAYLRHSAVRPAAPPAEISGDAAAAFERARPIELASNTHPITPEHATLTSVGLEVTVAKSGAVNRAIFATRR